MKQLIMILLVVATIVSCSKPTQHVYRKPTSTTKSVAKTSTLVNFDYSGKMSRAIEKAQASGKFIFLDFYTDYCPPCKLMDSEVFNNRDLASYLNKNFVNVKVNAGKVDGANLASLFAVRAYPTLIFADQNGNAVMRKEGGTSVSTVKYMAEEVLRATAMR